MHEAQVALATRHSDVAPVSGELWLRRRGVPAPWHVAAVRPRPVGRVSAASLACVGAAVAGYFVQRAYSTVMTLVPLVSDPGEQGMLVRYVPLAALVGAVVLSRFGGLVAAISVKHRPWIALLAIWTLGLLAVGLLRGNPQYYLLIDFEVMVVLVSGLLLGAQRGVWPFLERAYLWVFALGVPVVLLGLVQLDLGAMQFGGKFTATAYDSQYLLWPAGFFALTYGSLARGRARTIVLLAFGLCLVEQVLFQKRAPTGRLLTLLAFASLLTVTQGRGSPERKASLPAMLAGAIVAVVASAVVLGVSIPDVFDTFVARVTDLQGEQAASFENARFAFAARLLASLEGAERWFGRGLGGYLVDSTFGYYILTAQGVLVRGAASIEIGHTWAILKGGFVFLVVFNLPTLAALVRVKDWPRLDPTDRAAWAFVATTFAFQFTESLITHPNQLYWLLVGAAAGRLVSSQRSLSDAPAHRPPPTRPWRLAVPVHRS